MVSHFVPFTSTGIPENAYGFPGGVIDKQQFMIPEGNAFYQMPVPISHWAHFYRNPQNNAEFFTETGYSQHEAFISGLRESSQMEQYVNLHNEGKFISQFGSPEHQMDVQKLEWSSDGSYAFQVGLGYRQSNFPSNSTRKRSRERAYAAARARRLRLSLAIIALQELVPHSEVVGREAFIDLVIDYVKYLQYQMKDLSQKRLGGESTSNSVIFLEGHGHYIIQEQMLRGPLEETIGKLVAFDPSFANELLQSRGLVIMPTSFAEGFHEKP